MRDLAREMNRLRPSVATPWNDTRQKAVERRLLERQLARERSGRRLRFAVVAGAMAAALVIAVWSVRSAWFPARVARVDEATASPVAAASSAPSNVLARLLLADGSVVLPDPGSDVRWTEVTPAHVTASLTAGRARFDIVHRTDRLFRVEAGPIAVQVLGTRFTVERLGGGRSRVSVEEGHVRVSWAESTRDLVSGEEGVFPPPPDGKDTKDAGPSPPAVNARAISPGTDAAAPVAWRRLAERGAFEEAHEELRHQGGPRAVRDEVDELLLAADVERLSHHPSEAIGLLRQVITLHADDPRASLAAFTLGRILLEALGQPHEAAEAFRTARALAPNGELAPDALARQVEASAAAGDTAAARALAVEYVREYPSGSRLRSVRRYGGLE